MCVGGEGGGRVGIEAREPAGDGAPVKDLGHDGDGDGDDDGDGVVD